MAPEGNTVYFVGSFIYSLDGKDRLNIPSKFRRVMPHEANDSFVITKGFENCLHLYPSNFWHEFVNRYQDMFSSNDEEYRKFGLWIYRDTYEAQIDKQGRIQIPKVLLEYARLKKEIQIIGYNNRLELWNPGLCNDFVGSDDSKYMKMAVDFTSGATMGNPPNQSGKPSPQQQNYPNPPPPPQYYYGYPYNPNYNPYYPQYPPPGGYPGPPPNAPGESNRPPQTGGGQPEDPNRPTGIPGHPPKPPEKDGE